MRQLFKGRHALGVILLLVVGSAQAASVTWTISGLIDDPGVFSTIPEDSVWQFSVTFDPYQTGVQGGFSTDYAATATFSAAGYAASDTTAIIKIADAPNALTIIIDDPDAIMPDLEFTNIPGTFWPVQDIFVSLDFVQGLGSEDILDYIQLDIFALDYSYAVVRTASAVPPTGEVVGIGVSTLGLIPIPAAVWLFSSGLIALIGFCKRKS